MSHLLSCNATDFLARELSDYDDIMNATDLKHTPMINEYEVRKGQEAVGGRRNANVWKLVSSIHTSTMTPRCELYEHTSRNTA